MLLCVLPATSMAWDGYDNDNGCYIAIDEGNLVRSGTTKEIYDWYTGESDMLKSSVSPGMAPLSHVKSMTMERFVSWKWVEIRCSR